MVLAGASASALVALSVSPSCACAVLAELDIDAFVTDVDGDGTDGIDVLDAAAGMMLAATNADACAAVGVADIYRWGAGVEWLCTWLWLQRHLSLLPCLPTRRALSAQAYLLLVLWMSRARLAVRINWDSSCDAW